MKDCDRCSKGFKREWRFLSEFEKQPGVSGFPDSQSKTGFLLKKLKTGLNICKVNSKRTLNVTLTCN